MTEAAVHLSRLAEGYLENLREALSFVDFAAMVKPGLPVVLKPNLTYPCFRPGVMTNISCLEDLVKVLKDYTADITIGEGDGGGYNKFKMEEVFAQTGLNELARRYGVKLVNFSRLPQRQVCLACRNREVTISLPLLLLENQGLLITLPVPKMHCLTRVSLALKNQWGCLPDPHQRLQLHPQFDWLIWEVNRLLRPALVVMDGRFSLNRNGPLRGDVVPTNWLLVADDIVVADTLACRLLGLDPLTVPHIRHVLEHHSAPDLAAISCNTDYQAYAGPRFYLRRGFWDYPGFLTFRYAWLNWLGFRSPLADFLHWLMYLFRKQFYDYAYHRSRYSAEEWRGKKSAAKK